MLKIALCTILLFLSSCANRDETPRIADHFGINLDSYTGYYKIGQPYQINGNWHHPKYEEEFQEIGYASWYGAKFHGNLTANGERYNKHALTAAHPTLPMPSVVKVTNIDNDLSVLVMINDRGPFNKKGEKRAIDISEKAAEIINIKRQGIAKVKIEYLPNLTDHLHKELGIDAQTAIAKDKRKIAAKAFTTMYKMNNKAVPKLEEYYINITELKNKRQTTDLVKIIAKNAPVKMIKKNNKDIYSLKIGPITSQKEASILIKSLPKKIAKSYKYNIIKVKS